MMEVSKSKLAIIFALIFLLFISKLYSAQQRILECEVIEVSRSYKSSIPDLKGINFILIHHARNLERSVFSKLLKSNNGRQVIFYFKGKKLNGILFRLSNCFGRGLLLYKGRINIKSLDLIKLVLP